MAGRLGGAILALVALCAPGRAQPVQEPAPGAPGEPADPESDEEPPGEAGEEPPGEAGEEPAGEAEERPREAGDRAPAGAGDRTSPVPPDADAVADPDARPEREPGAEPAEPDGAARPAAPGPLDPAPEPPADPLTTERWQEPTVPLELHWHLLALPEHVVELAFTPMAFLVGVTERYRLDQRIVDLLRNDEGTIQLVPTIKLSGGDGFGAGAELDVENLIGREEQVEISALVRLNSDWEAGAEYEQSFATLEGRLVTAVLTYELDQNRKYYGFGNDTEPEDQRIIREAVFRTWAEIDLFALGSQDYGGRFRVGYRRSALEPGVGTGDIPLGGPMETVELPADFDDGGHDFGEIGFSLTYDTRDTEGRTTRGIFAEVDAHAAPGLDDANLGSAGGSVRAQGFIPVLPLRRVLVPSAGFALVVPLSGEAEIPLEDHVTLDRRHGLRGYSTGRFRDRLGWWTSLEYRWPIYEYQDTGVALTPSLFVDVGRVGRDPGDLFQGPIRWSAGAGLRGEHESKLLLLLEVGYSPEGIETGFSVGKAL